MQIDVQARKLPEQNFERNNPDFMLQSVALYIQSFLMLKRDSYDSRNSFNKSLNTDLMIFSY